MRIPKPCISPLEPLFYHLKQKMTITVPKEDDANV
jgi:hypothetical protein